METHGNSFGGIGPWRIAGWSLAALLLLLPLVAMRFTEEVNWTASDFLFAGVLIGGVGLLFELAVRSSRNLAFRAGAALALGVSFLIVWANAAVGMIGNEDNPYNLLFGIVLLIALLGSARARLRPAGMALAVGAAGIVHLAIAFGGLSTDQHGATMSALFAGPWLLAALLFRGAAKEAAR